MRLNTNGWFTFGWPSFNQIPMVVSSPIGTLTITQELDNTLTINRPDHLVSGLFDLQLVLTDPPINQTVTLDIEDLINRAVMLAIPIPNGMGEVGQVISVADGIAATEDPGGITSRQYGWVKFLTSSETVEDAVVIPGANSNSYTITNQDAGYTVLSIQYAVDARGVGTSAISPDGVEVAEAPAAVWVTFNDTDGTPLQNYTPEDGFPFLQALYSPDPAPMEIQGNAVWPAQVSGSSAHIQTGRTPTANCRLTADVKMVTTRRAVAQGITLWDSANDVRYTFRFNGSARRWQLYRFGGPGNSALFEGTLDQDNNPAGGVDAEFTDGVVRTISMEISNGTLIARLDGVVVANHSMSGDGYVSAQPGIQSYDSSGPSSVGEGAVIDRYLFEVL